MKIGALTLFKRSLPSNGQPSDNFVVAAMHWKKSLTWRWVVSWEKFRKQLGGKKFHYNRVYRGDKGFNFHASCNIPVIGHWSIQTQPNIFRK